VRAPASRLVGRKRELTSLVERVEDLTRGRGGAVLVEGEPGIGKTALARAVCAVAEDRGARICWGSGDELGGALPLLPLVDALGTGRGTPLSAVARLLDAEIDVAGSDLVSAAAEQLLALVDDVCSTGPLVLVVDDLQWADAATVAVWRRLASMVHQLPLLLIGVARPVPHRDDLVAVRRAKEVVERVRLVALSTPAVTELLADILGGEPDERLRTLADEAGGNPLYLVELAEALVRSRSIEVTGDVARLTTERVPSSLSAAIADRVGFLAPDTRGVLAAAALLGVDFPVADLAVVLSCRVTELLPALREATEAGVLVDGGGCLSFRHPLVRTALYEELPASARTAWHLEAARSLALAGLGADQVVRQLLAGLPAETTEVAEWVVSWLVEHGHALVGHAPQAAADLLRRLVDAPGALPHRAGLLGLLAEAHFRTGDHVRAAACASAGLDAVVGKPAPVDLHWTLAQCRSLTGRSAESLADLGRALAAPGATTRDSARLLVLSARAHWDLGEMDAAVRVADAALAQATRCDDRGAISWALHVRCIVAMVRGSMHAALPLLDRALAVASGDLGTGDLRLLLQINRAVVLGELDRPLEAITSARVVRQAADSAGNLVRLAQAQSALGQLMLDAGQWDDALVEVDLLADELKHPMVSRCDHGVAALIHLRRGEGAQARRHLDAAGPPGDGHVIASLALARSQEFEQRGDDAGALEVLRPGLADDVVEDLLPDAVRLAVRLGDLGTARAAARHADALVARLDVPHRTAAAAYCRALLDDDPAGLLNAAEAYREAGRPPRAATALATAAVLFAERNDRVSARAALTRAVEAHTSLGAEAEVHALLARLRVHGIRRGPQVKHRRASHGWESLTPAETRVVDLVVLGLSNQQIGSRLFLSRRTVATHVSHVLAKLGVRSRTDIAREAARRGVASG
jgi:ATP/maltotriose-dependent transcriptional regulator MalT